MSETCKTCKHWNRDSITSDGEKIPLNRGTCAKQDALITSIVREFAAVRFEVQTAQSFGCIHHEPNT